jgi:hypothetical protein
MTRLPVRTAQRYALWRRGVGGGGGDGGGGDNSYLADAQWTGREATADADTRKTFVSTVAPPPAGKEWRTCRTSSLAAISGTPANYLAISGGTFVVMSLTGITYSWLSTGLFDPGSPAYTRLVLTDIGDDSGASAVWASDYRLFIVSNTPAPPAWTWADTGVEEITATFGTLDGRGRSISGGRYRIDGGAWVSFTGTSPIVVGGLTGLTQTLGIQLQNANGFSGETIQDVSSASAPTLSATATRVGNTITFEILSVTGDPTPLVSLPVVTLDGVNVRGAVTGSGPWQYIVPTNAAAQTVDWTMEAVNVVSTADVVSSLVIEGSETTSTSAAAFGQTLTVTGSIVSGPTMDGAVWIIVPPEGLEVLSRSTAAATDGGLAINGSMKNPQRGLTSAVPPQGLDARLASYDAGLNLTFPHTFVAGDVLVCGVGQPGVTPAEHRRGVLRKNVPVFYFVAADPGPNWFAPAASGWTGRGMPQGYTLDVEPILDDLMEIGGPWMRSVSGMGMPSIATILDKFCRFEIGKGMTWSTISDGGYEGLTSYQAGDATSNYDRSLKQWSDAADIALMSNALTRDQKRQILIAKISKGIQEYDAAAGSGASNKHGDGGHHASNLTNVIAALHYTGRTSALTTLKATLPSNLLVQAFAFTAGEVTDVTVPHSDPAKPYSSRIRTITSVVGNRIGISVNRAGGDPTQMNLTQTRITRVSDSAAATVTLTIGGTINGLTTEIFVDIDAQPGSPFLVGQDVSFLPAQAISIGDFDYRVGVIPPEVAWTTYCPSYLAVYRGFYFGAGPLMYARNLGVWSSDWDAFQGYTERAALDNVPTAANDYGSDFNSPFDNTATGILVENFWNAYKSAIVPSLAVAPAFTANPVITGNKRSGQVLTSGGETFTGTPTPTVTRQWKRGAANIGTGAATYTQVDADVGIVLECVTTLTNSAGSVSYTASAGSMTLYAPLAYALLDSFDALGSRTVSSPVAQSIVGPVVEGTGALALTLNGNQNPSISNPNIGVAEAPAAWNRLAYCIDLGDDATESAISNVRPALTTNSVTYTEQTDPVATALGFSFHHSARGKRWKGLQAGHMRQTSWAGAPLTGAASGTKAFNIGPQQPANSNYNSKIKVDAFVRVVGDYKPLVCLTYDDVNTRQRSDLIPILSARGLVATGYLCQSLLGTGTKLTLAEALAMKNSFGWAWCLDSGPSDEPLTMHATVAAAIAQLNALRDTAIASGLSTAADGKHICYSYGARGYNEKPRAVTLIANGTATLTVSGLLAWGNNLVAGCVVKGLDAGTNPVILSSPTQSTIVVDRTVASGTYSATVCANDLGLATTCDGSANVTVATAGLFPGQLMTGRDVPANTTVVTVGSGTITVSNNVPATCARASFFHTTGEYGLNKMEDALIAAGYLSARVNVAGTTNTAYGLDIRQAMQMGSFALDSSTADATAAIATIAKAIESGNDLWTYSHYNATQNNAHFTAVADYLQARVAANALDVVTVTEGMRRISLRSGFA